MGILKRQYEQERKMMDKPKERTSGGFNGGAFLTVFLLVIVGILLFPFVQLRSPMYQAAPDIGEQATQLANRQNELINSMTRGAGVTTEQAAAAQQEIERKQSLLSTSVAQATSTEAANATGTSWAYTQTPLAAEQVERSLKIEKMQRDAYWSRFISPVKVIGLGALGFATLVLIVLGTAWAFVQVVPVFVARMRLVKEDRGERSIHLGTNFITRPDLMHQPTLTENYNGTMTASGGASDEYAQERIAANAARVKAVQGYAPGTRILKGTIPTVVEPVALPQPEQIKQIFPRPTWSAMDQWNGKGLPYGVSAKGLEVMDLNIHPHIGVLGKTGSGKSRRFLRPFLAGALASGQRVVIVGKQTDFWPFATHPNATVVPIRELTLEDEAQKYALFLRALVEEMNRRDLYLTQHRKSTWSIAGKESTLIVLDELGNALDLMPKQYAEQSYRYIVGLTKEGRKVGFNMVISLQRAKGFRDVMTQIGRAVFYVEDEQESRYALGAVGAETLPEGYFYSKFGSLQLVGAFEPTDEEIMQFLSQRQAKILDKPDWIDGKFRDVQIATPAAPQLPVDEIAQLAESVRSEWSPEMSKRAVARLLGKTYGGAWAAKIDQIIERLSATTPGNNAVLGASDD